ncbi:MAG TPA: ribonuclease H-like domain-containing protein [Candidatus Thermoplasmatota archaeon]|nr:ribonuclease H-like domain-containing protein [Candidatus Thermoplasmatota archaeon]
MLQRTFLLLPGIGPAREAMLWRKGVTEWAHYRALDRLPGIRPRLKSRHDELLALAETMLGRDPGFFARVLPGAEHWRAYRAFARDAAYLDIETTGDRTNAVTVVGVRRGGESRTFVRGRDYTPQAVSAFLEGTTCLVTFNGASFDLPVLASEGVALPVVPHVDLRVALAKAGLTGGLKRIEETLGLPRRDDVAGLTGWDAVKMWRRFEERGDEEALERLLAYNRADFENLEPLARLAADRLEAALLASIKPQSRLSEGAALAGP